MASKAITWRIDTTGIKGLQAVLKAVGEKEAPFLKSAMGDVAKLLEREVATRAPGSMGAKLRSSVFSGKGLGARLVDSHPGAKSMEFGRTRYYAGFHGHAQKATGHVVKRPGEKARPFIGIVHGDAAIGAVMPRARELIQTAMVAEFDRLAGVAAGVDE